MKLPESIQVIERSWLSSKQHRAACTHRRSASSTRATAPTIPQTLALPRTRPCGKKSSRDSSYRTAIPTSMGGNAAIRAKYGCRTSIPEGEAALIDDWDEQALILANRRSAPSASATTTPFAMADTLQMGGFGLASDRSARTRTPTR